MVRERLAGQPASEAEMQSGKLRAELVELVGNFTWLRATKIVDAILADYVLTPRRGVGK